MVIKILGKCSRCSSLSKRATVFGAWGIIWSLSSVWHVVATIDRLPYFITIPVYSFTCIFGTVTYLLLLAGTLMKHEGAILSFLVVYILHIKFSFGIAIIDFAAASLISTTHSAYPSSNTYGSHMQPLLVTSGIITVVTAVIGVRIWSCMYAFRTQLSDARVTQLIQKVNASTSSSTSSLYALV